MKGYEFLGRFLNRLERIQLFFCVGAIAVIVIVLSLEILLRHLAGINLQWALDLSALLMVWTCFIGTSMVYRKKGHIGIEALVRLFPEALQRGLNMSLYLLIGAAFVLLMVKASSLALVQRGQEIVSLSLPRSFLSIPVCLGSLLMGITSIYLGLGEVLGVESPEARSETKDTGESDEPY